jgi:prolyl-tRNA editing enzyme YbaK/EbsC (Cys-tRNA(Pro) deacylase)
VSDDDIEVRVRRVLETLGVPYELMVIDPAYADTAAFCAKYGVSLEHSLNTIIVGSKREPRQYAACVIKATTRLDVNHTVRTLMGVSRLSFASADETMALTGMMIGGVTLFALPETLPVYVDDTLMALDHVILGGGNRSLKIRTSPRVFAHIPNARTVAGLGIAAS